MNTSVKRSKSTKLGVSVIRATALLNTEKDQIKPNLEAYRVSGNCHIRTLIALININLEIINITKTRLFKYIENFN